MSTEKKTEKTYKLLVGAAAIGKAIDSIAKRGLKLDRDIQIAALSSMQHHADHGDVTLINRLVHSLPKGSRSNALREFIERFSGCVYNDEKKQFVHAKGKALRMDDAQKIMWFDLKPETAYKSVNPVEALKQLLTRLEKDRKELGQDSLVREEHIKGVQALLAAAQMPEQPAQTTTEFEPNF